MHPLDFLRADTADLLVNDSNRIRPLDFAPLFEKHGFRIAHVLPTQTRTVTDADRATFAEPFRSMAQDVLETTSAGLVVERV